MFLAVLLFMTLRTLVCTVPPHARIVGESMGTTWSVVLNAPDRTDEDVASASAAVQAALDGVERAMSTWDPESELSRFNAHASTEPFPLSGATLEVIALAAEVSDATAGGFDVTVRPLVALWGFGAGARAVGQEPEPDAAELRAVRAHVGYRLLSLDAAAGTARKSVPALEVDLSAIAKGYGVDQASAALLRAGYTDHMVEVGGEIRAVGERDGGGGWRLAIEQPDAEGRAVHAVVELSDRAMATSGDYRSFYEAGGRRLAHVIDPRTGAPVGHGVASVTVLHERAAVADAWATALMVLGAAEGTGVAERHGIDAYWIERTAEGTYVTRATSSFPPVEVASPAAAAADQ